MGMVTHYWHSNILVHGQLLDGCGFLRKTYNIQKNMSETFMYRSATTSTRILYIQQRRESKKYRAFFSLAVGEQEAGIRVENHQEQNF